MAPGLYIHHAHPESPGRCHGGYLETLGGVMKITGHSSVRSSRRERVVFALILTLLLLGMLAPIASAQGYIPPKPPLPPDIPPGAYWSWREWTVPVPKTLFNKDWATLTKWAAANYPGRILLDKYVVGKGICRLVVGRWGLMMGPVLVFPIGPINAKFCKNNPSICNGGTGVRM
jgi:hypothetical protein